MEENLKKNVCVCVCVCESLCCEPETNTLSINYTSVFKMVYNMTVFSIEAKILFTLVGAKLVSPDLDSAV